MSNQYGNPDAYNIMTKSLREILVPVQEYMAYVKKFEDKPDYGLRVADPINFDKNGERLYVAPYPYKRSAFQAIAQAKMESLNAYHVDFEHEDALNWQKLVMQRSSDIMRNAITESDLITLDTDGDCGVILNTSDGSIHPFMYSEVDNISVVTYSHLTFSCLMSYAHFLNPTMPDYEDSQKFFQHYIRENSVYLYLKYATPNGDRFRCADTMIKLSSFAPYEDSDVALTIKYIHAAFDNHTKVIQVP